MANKQGDWKVMPDFRFQIDSKKMIQGQIQVYNNYFLCCIASANSFSFSVVIAIEGLLEQ